MAILHGNWIFQSQNDPARSASEDPWMGYFLVWGETWRRIEPLEILLPAVTESPPESSSPETPPSQQQFTPIPHPFGMTATELTAWLRTLHQAQQFSWQVGEFPLEAALTEARTAKRSTRRRSGTEQSSASESALEKAQTLDSPTAETGNPRWQTVSCAFPTYHLHQAAEDGSARDGAAENLIVHALPQHSAAIQDIPENLSAQAPEDWDAQHFSESTLKLLPWQVAGVRLTAPEAIHFLQSLPLSSMQDDQYSWMGADLRFWAHVARWRLDLLARSKFLPGLRHLPNDTWVSSWQVLLDSALDQARLEQFSRQMPGICRAYGSSSPTETSLASPLATLLHFLNHTLDAEVRSVATRQPLPTAPLPKELALREWMQSLGQDPSLTAEPARLERLDACLHQWTAPLQQQISQAVIAFRTCFHLNPPTSGKTDWTLEYFLQSTHDPEFLVSAKVVWNNPVERLDYMGQTIDAPQETLLTGLGLASRLYPLLEPSLQSAQPQSCLLNPLQVYEFLKSTAWRLQDSGFGVVLPPSLSNQDGWANRLGLRIQAEAPKPGKDLRLGLQSLLNFKWELTIGGQRLSKAEFNRLVAQNTPLVEINGEWVELRPQDIRSAQSFFESRKDQMALSLEDALRISTGDTQMIEKLPVLGFEASGALQELISTLTSGNQGVETIQPPQSFRGELRPYQIRGVSWLAFLERWGLGACLADDMGLGKTPQLLGLLLHLQEQNAIQHPTLLVCPTSVLGNWEREVKRFAPTLQTVVHHGDKRPQGKAFAKAIKDKHLVITSYSLVHRDVKDLQSVPWQGVVLDEAQNIKNPDAKQSQAVRQLDAQFRVALTGTPVENRLSELWSILDFLNPGYLGPKNFFQRRFAVPIERYGDTDSLRTLRSLVQPFILRRLKTDRSIIQDLPEKQEMNVFCGLSAEQASLYQHLVEQSLVDIESAEGIQRHGLILALLTRLKQVCNHPALFKGEAATAAPSFRLASGKLQRLEEMLEEVLSEGDRCLIFTQFAEWGKLLQPYLAQHFSREVLFLYGGSSKKQREEMIDRFQNDPQAPRIFILSLKAGGVGLNLTRANHVFHFDRWWNPAVENQATDRVFRIGQTRNVQVHKFVCTGTLEEKIHEIIESKKALSEQVVGTGENWLTELDTDALRNLLLLDRATVIDDESA